MALQKDPINKTIYGDLKPGIELTFKRGYHASAAIILFSGIDILAHLDRPEDKAEGDADDFIRWVERYLRPHLPTEVSGEEVYSTRCAVLHSLGVESRRTRTGDARKVGFIVGDGPAIAYNPKIDPTLVLVNLDLLIKGFFDALDRFLMDAFAEPARKKLIERRLRQMLTSVPYTPENVRQKAD